MTSTLKGQLETMNTTIALQVLRKPNWLGILALLGAFLLVGGSLTWAAQKGNSGSDEKLLSGILEQLNEQGRKVKSSSVTTTNGESEVIVTLLDGTIRKYDSQGRITYEKDAKGKTTKYEKGMPVEERDSHGAILATYHYDRSRTGQVERSVKRSKAGLETKLFDSKGNITQMTNSNGTKVYSNYRKNGKGKTVSYQETDLNNNKTSTMLLNPKNGEIIGRISDAGVKTDIRNIKDNNGQVTRTIERDTAGNETVKNFQDGQLAEEIKNGIKTTYQNFLSDKGSLAKVIEKKMIPLAGGMATEQTIKEYDDAGHVVKQSDSQGTHTYKYDLDNNGRMIGKHEWRTDQDGKRHKEISTQYDEAGRVVASEESGKSTKTSYIVDTKGNMTGAVETTTFTMGGKTFTQTVRKVYDKNGRETSETDTNGVKSEFTYDSAGNRIRSQSPYEDSRYTFDKFNNMTSSTVTDHKSTTYTLFDAKTKLAKSKVKVKNSGALEVTTYGLNPEGKRVAYTVDDFGVKVSVNRNSSSDQPEKVTNYKNNGKIITTTYEYAGDYMASSKEVGPTGETDTTYNIWSKPVHVDHTDQFGRISATDYNYTSGKMVNSVMTDTKGKTVTEYNDYEDPQTIYRHNDIGFPRDSVEERTYSNGMLTSTVTQDFRGVKYTSFDANEMATTVHTVNHHGWPRENWVTNVYDKGGDVVRTLQVDMRGYTVNDMDQDGLTQKTVRVDYFGFPKKKTTTYGYAKGEMVTSTETDDRGQTENQFNADGLMTHSVRTKIFGFPRIETTDYKYDGNGFMTYSEENDENGVTDSYYNIDEVVDTSHRVNTYGHARDQWTKFEYDNEGFMTISKESDLKGTTVSQYNIDGLAITQVRNDHYGVKYGQVTFTYNNYDDQGFMTTSTSKNLLGKTVRTSDRDGLTRLVVQDDNFGLEYSKHKVSDNYEYDDHGRMLRSLEHDLMGWSVSKYDINGDATWSERFNYTGLNLAKDTTTQTTFQKDTGMTTYRISQNAMSKVESFDFDPVTGLESRQETYNVYGLTSTLHTTTQMVMDDRHGLTRETYAHNAANQVHTVYDTVQDGTHGIATSSDTVNTWCLNYAKYVHTDILCNPNNGMTSQTIATSRGHGSSTDPYTGNGPIYSRVKTTYDDVTYGFALRSDGVNTFGTHFSQYNHTDITTNPNNGLQEQTISVSRGKGGSSDPFVGTGPISTVTRTKYKDQTTGVAYESKSMGNFGLKGSLFNSTWIDCNETTGLNRVTESETQGRSGQDFVGDGKTFSRTRTTFNDTTTGVANHSLSKNSKGVLGSNFNETWVDCNEDTGLNRSTLSETSGMVGSVGDSNYVSNKQLFGMTKTTYKDTTTGVADHSMAKNAKGVLGSNFNETWIDCNEDNGLNTDTLSVSSHMTGSLSDGSDFGHTGDVFSMTKTTYDDQETGVARHSMAKNSKGILGSNFTDTVIDCNVVTGLNTDTISTAYAMTPGTLEDHNTFSHGPDVFSMTKTTYDDQTTGVAQHSMAKNAKGVLGSNFTDTVVNCNVVTGLNTSTIATTYSMTGKLGDPNDFNHGSDVFSMTKTTYDDQTYGVPQESMSKNAKGVLGSNFTDTAITANIFTGLNTSTIATSYAMTGSLTDPANFSHGSDVFSMTKTTYDDKTYGVAQHSMAKNAKGVLGSNFTDTVIDANITTGLNTDTIATTYAMTGSLSDSNDFSHGSDVFNMTKTTYDDKTYGVAQHSYAKNAKGLLGSNFTDTAITANVTTGLNTSTIATAYAMTGSLTDPTSWNRGSDVFSMTKTTFDDQTYGTAQHSYSKNAKGLLGSNFTDTAITANVITGLNTSTIATSYAMTGSLTDPTSWNRGSDVFSMTKTTFDDQKYGTSQHSYSKNAKGLLGSNFTDTAITANVITGLNTSTIATSYAMTGSLTDPTSWNHGSDVFSMTKTTFDDQTYGTSQHSYSKNAKGLLGSNFTDTAITANVITGLNTSTIATSYAMTGSLTDPTDFSHGSDVFSMTKTTFDDQTYGTAQHSYSKNAKGLLGSNFTDTAITANVITGLNTSTIATSYAMTGSLTDPTSWNHGSDVFSMTKTTFDDQTYGTAQHSYSKNAKGLLGSNFTDTAITANVITGLNTSTIATSYAMTGSLTDPTSWNHGSDVFSMTKTTFDDQTYGTAQHSYSKNAKGLLGSNFTDTAITANVITGLNTSTIATSYAMTGSLTDPTSWNRGSDVFSMTKTTFDDQTYGTAQHSYSKNAKGLLGSNFTDTAITANVITGLNTSTIATSYAMTGSLTDSTDWNRGSDVFSMTKTTFDDQTYGTAQHSYSKNAKGLLGSNFTDTAITANVITGLNTSTIATSYAMTGSLTDSTDWNRGSDVFSMTKTTFDDQTYGTAQHSYSKNAKGLLGSNFTDTAITANVITGLNTSTIATSYAMTGSLTDPTSWNRGSDVFSMTKTTFDDQTYGTAQHSYSKNAKGLLGSNFTDTAITANVITGLNTSTIATSYAMTGSLTDPTDFGHGSDVFSMTKTTFDDQTYGTAQHSYSKNAKGLLGSNFTDTAITANVITGLNTSTIATSYAMTGSLTDPTDFGHGSDVFSMTKTTFDDQTYGTAQHSYSKNAKGLLGSNFTDTAITANVITGLNTSTIATSYAMTGSLTDPTDFSHGSDVFSMTKTTFDDQKYGTAQHSYSKNAKGLLGSNFTDTAITANNITGLNTSTIATSYAMAGSLTDPTSWNHGSDVFSMTKTTFDDQKYGTAQHSYSKNAKGLLGSNFTDTAITANVITGLNTSTIATSYAMTGGLTDSTNFSHGSDVFSMTKTTFDDQKYGTAQHSMSKNAKGLLGSNFTDTTIHCNTTTGLNTDTTSTTYQMTGSLSDSTAWSHGSDAFSKTKTTFDDVTYGTAQHSLSKNSKGLLGGNFNETWMDTNTTTGLNKHSYSQSCGMTGSESVGDANFSGDGNLASCTRTDFDDKNTGVAQHSVGKNSHGVYGSRFSETWIDTNTTTGLNSTTYSYAQGMSSGSSMTDGSYNGNGTIMSQTKTVFDDATTGVATHSYGASTQGLNFARFTDTWIDCNTTTGLNTQTIATSRGKGGASDPFQGNGTVFSKTTTDFDDQTTGVAKDSTTVNTYGLGATLTSKMNPMWVDKRTGQNLCTISSSDYGWTETWYKDGSDGDTTGVALASDTNNCKGLMYGRHSWVSAGDMAVNETTGLNEWTHTESLLSTTDTWFDPTYGCQTSSKVHNTYGLTLSQDSVTTAGNIIINHDTGLTQWSKSTSDFGYTESWFNNNSYGNISSSHTHNYYGATKCLDTTTTFQSNTEANQDYGMNTYSTAVGYMNTTYTWYETDYGTSNKSYSVANKDKNGHNIGGADGSTETWTDITCNQNTGMNESTKATTALGVTTTDAFDPLYGTALHSHSDNVSGTLDGRSCDTWMDCSSATGFNNKTYSTTKLSQTWTDFDSNTGAQTDSFSQMTDDAKSLGDSINTTTYYFVDSGTNLNQASIATNLAGWTETWFDSRGLAVANDNYAAVGVAFLTHTVTHTNDYWGVTDYSTAYSYSREDSSKLLSTTTNYMNVGTSSGTHNNGTNDGTVNYFETVNSTGAGSVGAGVAASDVDVNHTQITDYNQNNGNKITSTSWNDQGWSTTDYNDWGVEKDSTNYSVHGPEDGRVTNNYTTLWDGDTGVKRHAYSESGMSKTWSYFDANGLPSNDGLYTINYDSIAASALGYSSAQIQAYTIKSNTYASAEGDQVEATSVTGDIWWSGVPSETTTWTALTCTRTEQDVNGFAKFSHTEKIFSDLGGCKTDTWNDIDPKSGMTTHSHTVNNPTKHGTGYSDSYMDSTYGVCYKSENYSPKQDDSGGFDQTETNSSFDHGTGLTTGSTTKNVGGDDYEQDNYNYNDSASVVTNLYNSSYQVPPGLPASSYTSEKCQMGEDSGHKSYDSYYGYNPWTGLREFEHRWNWGNKNTSGDTPDYDDHYYDAHGVDEEWHSFQSAFPTGQQQQFTDFTGLGTDAQGDPNGMIIKYGTDHTATVDAMVVTQDTAGHNQYNPTHSHTLFDTSTHKYITWTDVYYTLDSNNKPVSATESDDHGTEVWTMNGTYDTNALTERDRTVTGGGTFDWTYHPENDPADSLFHTSATINYTVYLGMFSGSGSETYNTSGILTQQVLNNTNAMNETINFSNDGNFVTKGVGTRQDGQTTIYYFTGADLSSSEDDKGTTTWNTSTMQRQSTTGKLGTFLYTYTGNAVTQITDTNNTMKFDQYWNLQQWTDSKGVVHTYTAKTYNSTKSEYWTSATEKFTDANGGSWTGTVTYDPWGFYFDGEKLSGTDVKVDGSAAQNTTALNTSAAATFIQSLLAKYNDASSQKETWTWQPSGSSATQQKLGDLQSAALKAADVSLYADVVITINPDGSTDSTFSNIRFNEEQFTKENRYKPAIVSTWTQTFTQATAPATGDNRNMSLYNNVFSNSDIGTRSYISNGPKQVQVGTQQVQTGTDKNGKAIYTTEPVYSNQYTVTYEDWGKQSDGWQWVDSGTTQQTYFADSLTENNSGTVVVGPIGDDSNKCTVGDTSLANTTSTPGAVSVSLGGSGLAAPLAALLPTENASTNNVTTRPSASGTPNTTFTASGWSNPAASLTPGVQAQVVAASNPGSPANGQASNGRPSAANGQASTSNAGPAVTAAAVGQASTPNAVPTVTAAAVNQDALVAKFKSIKTLADITAFLQMVADAVGMKGILNGLENSTAADLMKALVNGYKAVFGPAYKDSLVGKLVSMATDNDVVVEDLQTAVSGNETLPTEVKRAAKIAAELKDAKKVTRDEDGRVVEAVDQKGGLHQFSYDASGLTETFTPTSGKAVVSHYDNSGQLLSETSGGVSKTFSYQLDAKGNVSQVNVTERTEDGVATLTYDGQGRLVASDRNGQKSTITYSGDSKNSYTVQDYDASGNLQETRTYTQGRVSQVKQADGSTDNYDYMTDASGKVLAMTETVTDKDGKRTIMKYNSEGRLVTILGADDKKVEKTQEASKIAEQAFGFEAGKPMFGDPRMDGMRLDQNVLLGVAPQQPQQQHQH